MTEDKLNILADEAVVRMAQEGSATAYEYLIQKYREVAKIKARTYYIAGGDNEDAVQEGMIGIFKAVRDYEPGAGASFSSFPIPGSIPSISAGALLLDAITSSILKIISAASEAD